MTPIPAMQAALEALETALPLAKEEWTVRADWDTAGMAAIAKMESALSLLRAALGEPQPVAIRYKVRNGRWRYLNLPFTKGWTFPPNLGTPEPLYASPVAAAPQGDAKPERVGAEGWKRLAESQQAFIESDRRVKAISDRYGLADGERGAVSPSCAATDQPQQEKRDAP